MCFVKKNELHQMLVLQEAEKRCVCPNSSVRSAGTTQRQLSSTETAGIKTYNIYFNVF